MSVTAPGPVPVPGLEPHQRSMLQACKDGRLTDLQQLFTAFNVHKGDATVHHRHVTADGPPETTSMFIAATYHDQFQILEYLLSVYPCVDLNNDSIARAIIKTNNLETFKLVVEQSPKICSLEFDYLSSLLSELCRNGPRASPLVHHLLDSGGIVEAGGYSSFSALGVALANGMPIEILQKIVANDAVYGLHLASHAIQIERFDAVPSLLSQWHWQLDARHGKALREALENCNDKGTIGLVNRFVNKCKVGTNTKRQFNVVHFFRRVFRHNLGHLFRRVLQVEVPPLSQIPEPEIEKVSLSSNNDIGKIG